ncbi:sensor histidine kinase, partial [Bacteroides thetaiotaomicron]
MTLGNIPRLYTALADWIACMLCVSLFPHRLKGWQLRAVQAFFLAVMCVFLAATGNVPVAWFVPCILLSAALMFVFIYLCCAFSPANAGYYCVRAFILAELAASLEWQLYYYAAYSAGGTSLPIRILFLAGTYALIFGLMYALERRRRESAREMEITWRELLSALAIGAAIYAISNLSYFYADTPFSGRLTMEIFNIRTLVDLGGVAVLYAYHIQLSELHVRREKDALTNVLRTQYSQYQLSQDSVDLINMKYHDLKHRSEALSARGAAALEEKAELDRALEGYSALVKTGSEVLDTVLTEKKLYCEGHSINMTCVADGSKLDFLDPVDVYALLGNAID